MPQLDHVTYLSQYFWLCVFYGGLYYSATKYWLPRVSRIMAYRQARLQHMQHHAGDSSNEVQHVEHSVHGVLSQAHHEARSAMHTAQTQAQTWAHATRRDIITHHYGSADAVYMKHMAQQVVSQECAYYHALTQAPLSLRVAYMLRAIREARG